MSSRILVALRVPAPPARTFEVFTREIGLWWKPNGLFMFTSQGGRLSFEPGPGGRLIETAADGSVFEIGRITRWEPPHHLELTWRQASFTPEQSTHVHVTFEAVDDETRVTVEHFAWDTIPQEHAARHTFPLRVFLLRHGEWWQTLLRSLATHEGRADG